MRNLGIQKARIFYRKGRIEIAEFTKFSLSHFTFCDLCENIAIIAFNF